MTRPITTAYRKNGAILFHANDAALQTRPTATVLEITGMRGSWLQCAEYGAASGPANAKTAGTGSAAIMTATRFRFRGRTMDDLLSLHLKKAAIAAEKAGLRIKTNGETDYTISVLCPDDGLYYSRPWNPDSDNGDSRMLQVSLNMEISVTQEYVIACCRRKVVGGITQYRGNATFDGFRGDKEKATRMAVLGCASAFGGHEIGICVMKQENT